MADENKCAETKDHGCIIQCECFRKFLIVAFGTFVGVYLALSLFALVHKPQIPCAGCPCPMAATQMQIPPLHHPRMVANPFKTPHKHFGHHQRKHFQGDMNQQ